MATTTASLVQRIKSHLGESTASVLAELPTGTGGAATISGDNGIVRRLNDAKDLACKTLLPVRGAASVAYGAAVGWKPYDDFTAAAFNGVAAVTSSKLWWAERVKYGSTYLAYADEGRLQIYASGNVTTAGTAAYWSPSANGVLVYPVPAAGGTVTAEGLMVPPDTATTGADWAFLTDSQAELLVLEACVMLVGVRAADDAAMGGRLPGLVRQRDALAATLYALVPDAIKRTAMPLGPAGMTQAAARAKK